MSKVELILQPDADGTVHLPVPPEWKNQNIKITAELEAKPKVKGKAIPGLLKEIPGPFWMAPDFDAPLEDFKEYME